MTPRANTEHPKDSRGGCAASVVSAVVELEHVEEIADRRLVRGNVWIVVAAPGVRQVVAAAARQRLEAPIALDEFQDRDVIGIAVHDPAALREGRDRDQRNA